ncbi:MAG TPA: FAD/NAD(P)-binding protein [Aquaticitalea sp.]|nr:FAD/NAD(P)-binding protein [Aquaticitalea sp.]HNU59443.1 FAD/NAD(P)-binding protein [Aquaticitalea sp.]
MDDVVIIGAGFCGTMVAVNLILKSNVPLSISIIDRAEHFNKGIAYNPYSKNHLLNVPTGKMSAFPNKPDHFLDWVMKTPDFIGKDKSVISSSFLPRSLYGDYLKSIWNDTQKIAKSKKIMVKTIDGFVKELDIQGKKTIIRLEDGCDVLAKACVLATGNQPPRNQKIKNLDFYKSQKYFQNPWKIASVTNIASDLPILVIGNGLTMVDTVFGLLESGFKGQIHAISPNGFNLLPHEHSGATYTKLQEELAEPLALSQLVSLANKHIKGAKRHEHTAPSVIDAFRPFAQKLWKNLSVSEKHLFMARLRHLWNVARHRIPQQSHDKIRQLQIDGQLSVKSGRIIDLKETEKGIDVSYFDKQENKTKALQVFRIINCTGPESDLMKIDGLFKKCISRGMMQQDALNLGISADTSTFQVKKADGNVHDNLFTLGSNLKGELWESTAVNELKVQAEQLADVLCKTHTPSCKTELIYD